MDFSILLEYSWVLLVLIALEGILAADNALVLAIIIKDLPEKERKKALFYGLAGAFVFRLGSLLVLSYLVGVWQVQAIGALYLCLIAINHLFKKYLKQKDRDNKSNNTNNQPPKLWWTILKVEIADLAFAIDSILAAVALAVSLPKTTLPPIGGMDGGQFIVIFLGGIIGLILMRYAATYFVKLLQKKPSLETTAFLIVGWVGIKLAVYTLSHPELSFLPEDFAHNFIWKITFWIVLLLITLVGWFREKRE